MMLNIFSGVSSMTPTLFEELLNWFGPFIQKNDTKMRKAIHPSERLSVCLRYLVMPK